MLTDHGRRVIEERLRMGMSTHVKGFRPPDEKWHRMKAIWDACQQADIDPPDEVASFFDYHAPDPTGIEVELGSLTGVTEWKNDYCSGLVVELDALPPNITHLRFENCW